MKIYPLIDQQIDRGTATGQLLVWNATTQRFEVTLNPSAPSTGIFGHWSRTGTVLTPAVADDGLTIGNADFTVDTDGLTYDSATGRVGVGITPNNTFQVANLINFDDTDFNVALGTNALVSGSGSFNVGIGFEAGRYNFHDVSSNGNTNVYIGYASGRGADGTNKGRENVGLGFQTLTSIVTGFNNVAIGSNAMALDTSGNSNIAIGSLVMQRNKTGVGNVVIGSSACRGQINATQSRNVFVGEGIAGEAGNLTNNAVLGYRAGDLLSTGSSNILIGHRAGGKQTTNSNLLILDNLLRASAAAEITDSIIYGVMNATPASQTLRLNASVTIPYDLTVGGNTDLEGLLQLNADAGTAGDIITSNGASDPTWVTPTSHTQISFSMYDAEPARGSETSLDGAFLSLATAQPLDSVPTDLVVSKGTGKLIVVVNAGTDLAGEITVTGDSVDRNTGAVTIADTDTLTIDALTTDGSDTDTNGNARHAFTGAYITSKWFTGTVTLSTTDLTLTDVDVYHVSFEQFDDTANLTLDTFDANILTTNVNAEFDAYLYAIMVTGDKCNITREASLNVGADGETALVNRYWRLRRGLINKALDGTTDGTWVAVHYSNSPAYVEDVSIKVWATEIVPLTLT